MGFSEVAGQERNLSPFFLVRPYRMVSLRVSLQGGERVDKNRGLSVECGT